MVPRLVAASHATATRSRYTRASGLRIPGICAANLGLPGNLYGGKPFLLAPVGGCAYVKFLGEVAC